METIQRMFTNLRNRITSNRVKALFRSGQTTVGGSTSASTGGSGKKGG